MRLINLLTAILLSTATIYAETLDIETSLTGNAGSGTFAPYYITSNNFGVYTQRNALTLSAGMFNRPDTTRRLDISYGLQLIGQVSNIAPYSHYHADTDTWSDYRAPRKWGWIQQLYASLRYRSLFITAGWQQVGSAMLDDQLSSGDLTWSANARPMPGVRFGFNRFVDIPLTAKALQVQGEIFYGRPTDNTWLRQHFNYWSSFITTGRLDSYRRLYFRTNPTKPLYVTFGMQAASQYCGHYTLYEKGHPVEIYHHKFKLSDLWGMIVPRTDDSFVEGNHLGSWDLRADWRLGSEKRHTLSAYFQWLWEDGSGIGKLNGWDGLWGVQYSTGGAIPWLKTVVVEYLDFTNQSGPTHYAPGDFPGTTLGYQATGSDSYYNNYYYNGYAHYGLSQGTPFMRSPMYNTDGYLRFIDTRVRGFHMGLSGAITPVIDWTALMSWRTSLGDSYVPRIHKVRDLSWSASASWRLPRHLGMTIKGQIAMDHGTLYGDTFGALVTLSWNGSISLH